MDLSVNGISIPPHGFVNLLDVMGDDAAIEQAARVSYDKGTRPLRDTENLIRYLYNHRHTSPFEQVEFKFLIKMPIFVARQMVRHRTASLNEVSGRYSELPNEYFFLERSVLFEEEGKEFVYLPAQSKANKQGRADEVKVPLELFLEWNRLAEDAHKIYEQLCKSGVSRELARLHLPLSTYTTWVWKMDLHNLLHFLRLRLDKHAQEEIRDVARAIFVLAYPHCPIAFNCFLQNTPDCDLSPYKFEEGKWIISTL